MVTTDVLIVGAGPAGLATALNLVKIDPQWAGRMLVLEKQAHPRHKLCAGGITGLGLRQLSNLGLELEVPYVPVKRAVLHYQELVFEVRGDPVFVVTQRQEFDAWLADQARERGVPLRENVTVQGLELSPDAILAHTEAETYKSTVLVAADGSRGVVRPWVGMPENPPRVARVLEVVTRSVINSPEHTQHLAHFDFTSALANLQGYHWSFPSLHDGQQVLNKGIYDARIRGQGPKADLPGLLKAVLEESGCDLNEVAIRGHPIHWFTPWNRFSDNRVLMVGDAAGVDSLFGEGIALSLGYGAAAARSIQRAFAFGDFSFRTYRRVLFLSPTGRHLLLRWFIARCCYHLCHTRSFMRGLWRVGRTLADILAP